MKEFKQPTAVQKSVLERIDQVMGVFAEVDHTLPSSYIRMFIKVAMSPGKGISEYARDMGVYQAMSSRILLEIGPKSRNGTEGLGLVEQVMHPQDMRFKQYFLTTKGCKLFQQLMAANRLEEQ